MTTYRHPKGKTWRYDFWWKGRRYTGSTDQLNKADADLVESQIKTRLRQQAWGIAPSNRDDTPFFTKWAELYFEHQAKRVTRPDIMKRTIRMVLAFWGTKPAVKAVEGGPYHSLRLADPILDPELITKFEQWMDDRGLSGSTKNSYRSAVSGMYRLAMRPAWRKRTLITSNPMAGIERDRGRSRKVTLTVQELQRWIEAAPTHVRLAMAIAALAPKLRLSSILALRWNVHFDPGLQFITVHEHKTIRSSGEPQVVPIDPQLREILTPFRDAAKKTRTKAVITFRGEPVGDIKKALQNAARTAGLAYGIRGVTFHSLRHTMATLLAELGVPEKQRQMVMGHSEIRTTQGYTHLKPIHERAPLATLSAALPIKGTVQGPRLVTTKNIEENTTTLKGDQKRRQRRKSLSTNEYSQ